jgi:hypothetical protein
LAKDTDVRALLLPRSAARGGGKLYLIWFHECDRLTNFRVLMSVIGNFGPAEPSAERQLSGEKRK